MRRVGWVPELTVDSNGNKGIRLCKERFICDLKLQWGYYESVARIRLVKTENPSVCVTVNCKLWRLAIVLSLLVGTSCVYKVSINPIIQSKPRLICHVHPLHVTVLLVAVLTGHYGGDFPVFLKHGTRSHVQTGKPRIQFLSRNYNLLVGKILIN
jgi:hypothetical protein